jgi:hypothetical protein
VARIQAVERMARWAIVCVRLSPPAEKESVTRRAHEELSLTLSSLGCPCKRKMVSEK